MRVSGNSRRNWQPARACWQGPNHHAPNRGRNRVDHRTITGRSWGNFGTRSQYSFVAIALFSMKFIAPPSTKKELTPERRVYALNSVTLQQQSIGMADPWRTLNRLVRAIGDRALAGNVGSASPHARPGPDPPPYQMEVTAAVIAVCSACVLRSLGQIRAGSPQQGFPLRRSICSITTVLQFEVANNLSTNGFCCLVVV